MLLNRIRPEELIPRLDAEYYQSHFVDNGVAVRRCGLPMTTIGAEIAEGSPVTYGIVQPGGFVPNGQGVPMVRCVDMSDGVLNPETVLSVTPEIEGPYKRARITPGDLLLSIVGTVGRTAVVPGSLRQANLNQSVARLRFRPSFDTHWAHAFLSTTYGQALLLREQRGFIQKRLNIEDIPFIQVLRPAPEAQRYIGDKVRLAERLRERARSLDTQVRRTYRAELDRLGYAEAPHRKSYRAKLRDRLDPAYYDPSFTSVLDAPWLLRHSEPLSNFFTDGSYGDLPDSGSYGTGGKWLLRATDLDRCMTHWDAGVRVPGAEVGAKSEVKQNDILLEVKGAIEKCAIGRGPAVGKHVNGTVFRLSPTGINAGYLCLHLTAEVKRKYAAREAVNNIIQYLNLGCIRSLPVVRLDVDLEGQLGDTFLAAIDAQAAATSLTAAATTLVEHLIEGKVTEADLVAAQKALESGDRGLDRTILQALRQNGNPAQPLVADLDGLYGLLDELDQETNA